MYNNVATQRILSIDALRGITILVMIFVNELAGVEGIPAWMKHMPADADAMTFVDVVFPAFLFIVGMSIPFAINNRLAKGDSWLQLQGHVLFRAVGLIVLGVFMVNAEGEAHEASMIMSIALWSLLFYTAVILVWNVYTFENKMYAYILRGVGVIGLIILAFLYHGGENGTEPMKPHWWGILGLIGWAYLIACILYQLSRGRILSLVLFLAACVMFYVAGKEGQIGWISAQSGHAVHTSLVVSGIILSLLFFDQRPSKTTSRRFAEGAIFAAALAITGFVLRPYYHISKIHATPTWALYSALSCTLLFMFLYWLIDLKNVSAWTKFFKTAASNPLLTYIIPFVVYAFMQLVDISWPTTFYQGAGGIAWSLVYAVLVMTAVIGLNKLRIKLQL
jgi:predicted acyltransferase